MTRLDLTMDEAHALTDAALAREHFIVSQLIPGTPWGTDRMRSRELQSALDKLSDDSLGGARTRLDLTLDEVRALTDAALAREDFIVEQLVPGTPWGTDHVRSAELQSALDKLSDVVGDAMETAQSDTV